MLLTTTLNKVDRILVTHHYSPAGRLATSRSDMNKRINILAACGLLNFILSINLRFWRKKTHPRRQRRLSKQTFGRTNRLIAIFSDLLTDALERMIVLSNDAAKRNAQIHKHTKNTLSKSHLRRILQPKITMETRRGKSGTKRRVSASEKWQGKMWPDVLSDFVSSRFPSPWNGVEWSGITMKVWRLFWLQQEKKKKIREKEATGRTWMLTPDIRYKNRHSPRCAAEKSKKKSAFLWSSFKQIRIYIWLFQPSAENASTHFHYKGNKHSTPFDINCPMGGLRKEKWLAIKKRSQAECLGKEIAEKWTEWTSVGKSLLWDLYTAGSS